MSYDATVVKAFIASPSDVADERNVIRHVIHEWNSVNSEHRKLVVMPIGWETHSSPAMGASAQSILNAQLLSGCDLLIAVFWTRLGTPTGKAESGTVEEIREHMQAGKPAMIYFSSAPVRLESVEDEQYRALRTFRDELKTSGLLETYESVDEFRAKFARQLAQTIIREFDAAHEGSVEPNLSVTASAPEVSLSNDARDLLRAAANDSHGGSITLLRTAMGDSVLAGSRDFTEPRTPRAEARWKAALEELETLGLVSNQSGNRFRFDLTHDGYTTADRLGLKTEA